MNIPTLIPVEPANPSLPGKPLLFGKSSKTIRQPFVYGETAKLIPFVSTAPPEPTPLSAPAPTPGSLTLDLEMPSIIVASADLTVTYLLGNPGSAAVWIEPNRLVPALTTWTVSIDGTITTTLPAGDAIATAATLPMRMAIPLNPGEFLTWQRVLPAAALWPAAGSQPRAHHDRQVGMRLAVPYWRSAEAVTVDAPAIETLSATVLLPVATPAR